MYHRYEIYENETIHIKKCRLALYKHCTFKNCHFIIKNPYELALYDNVYDNCTFDVDLSYTTDIYFGNNEIKYLQKWHILYLNYKEIRY